MTTPASIPVPPQVPCPPTNHAVEAIGPEDPMTAVSPPVTLPEQLSIQAVHLSAGTARITVAGEIDLATTDELRAGLLHALVTGLPHHLEVDLTGVTFIDCGGLTVLIVASQVAARTGCRLEVINPSPFARRMLETTGLAGILTPHPCLPARPGYEEMTEHSRFGPAGHGHDRRPPGRRPGDQAGHPPAPGEPRLTVNPADPYIPGLGSGNPLARPHLAASP